MRTPSPLPPAPRIKRKRQKTAQNGTSCILFLEMGCIFLFYNVTIAIAMTNIHPFTTAAACILTAGAALFTSSCQPASPESYARQFATAQHVSVHGYNGRETLTSRVYADWGSMPANARRAMEEYIKGAEWKTMDYIRPQYFIQVDRSFWAICIDNDGNMTGIIPFRNGKDARKMSVNNHFKMLVNTTDRAPALGYAILKNLAYADGLRVSTRKADGLETPVPAPPAMKVVVPPKGAAPSQRPLPNPQQRPFLNQALRKKLLPTILPERKRNPLRTALLKAKIPRQRMMPLSPMIFKPSLSGNFVI